MLRNDDFLPKWELKHKKGIGVFLIKNTLFPIFVLLIANIILWMTHHQANNKNFGEFLMINLIFIIIILFSGLSHWFKAERKYKKIISSKKETL